MNDNEGWYREYDPEVGYWVLRERKPKHDEEPPRDSLRILLTFGVVVVAMVVILLLIFG
jgi:hypothetical protein